MRIPDICVLSADLARGRIIRTAPLLCVEILSPCDNLKAMRKRVQDYFDMGVPAVWMIEPDAQTAFVCNAVDIIGFQAEVLRLWETSIELAVDDIFATPDT